MSEIEKNFSARPGLSGKRLRQVIHNGLTDLVYISETDAPVELLDLRESIANFKDFLKEFPDIKSKTPIEEISFGKFFERLISDRDWHGGREKAQVSGFRELKRLLEGNLSDLHVYRLGTINIDIFVVGRDREGNFIGVRTKAVET